MTVDDALKAMSAIESQRDGSQAKTVIVQALNRKLLEDPENFWEFYFETLNAADLNPYQALAERLLRSGAVDETFGRASALLAWDEAGTPPESQQ